MFAKRILKSAAVMLAASVLMVACGGQAHAQTSPHLFKDQAGRPFSMAEVLTFQSARGKVNLAFVGSPNYAVSDGTGTVYQTLVASPYIQQRFVRIGTTTSYLNTELAFALSCTNNKSQWAPRWDQAMVSVTDNCATFYAAQAKAN